MPTSDQHPSSEPSSTTPPALGRRRGRIVEFLDDHRLLAVVLIVVAFLIAPEIAVRALSPPKAVVRIVNQGETSMTGLSVEYNGSKIAAGDLSSGATARIHLTPGPLGPLRIQFTQRGNPVHSFEIADYDPRFLLEEGIEQVYEINGEQLGRSVEEISKSSSPLVRALDQIQAWLDSQTGRKR